MAKESIPAQRTSAPLAQQALLTSMRSVGYLIGDPCVCALLRHVGSVLIVIGSAPRGGDDECGEIGEVGGL